jgi:hypothetical protein
MAAPALRAIGVSDVRTVRRPPAGAALPVTPPPPASEGEA